MNVSRAFIRRLSLWSALGGLLAVALYAVIVPIQRGPDPNMPTGLDGIWRSGKPFAPGGNTPSSRLSQQFSKDRTSVSSISPVQNDFESIHFEPMAPPPSLPDLGDFAYPLDDRASRVYIENLHSTKALDQSIQQTIDKSIELPKFELPIFELPIFEPQRFEPPKYESPRIGFSAHDFFLRGIASLDKGEHTAARPDLEHALSLGERKYDKKDFPDGHEFLAQVRYSLGNVASAERDYEGARKFYGQSIEIYRRLYPEEAYPDGNSGLATSLDGLGTLLLDSGKHDEGLNYVRLAMEMRNRLYSTHQYPDGHSDLANSLMHLGSFYRNRGDHELAQRYAEQALEMVQKLYPQQQFAQGHRDLANAQELMGNVLTDQGEFEQAKAYAEKALDMRRAILWRRPEIVSSLCLLGSINRRMGMLDDAIEYYEEALSMLQRIYPKADEASSMLRSSYLTTQPSSFMHPNSFMKNEEAQALPEFEHLLTNLAAARKEQGDYYRARLNYSYLLAIQTDLYPKEQYPHGHINKASTLRHFGEVTLESFNRDYARRYVEQSLVMYQDLSSGGQLPRSNLALAETLHLMGNILANEGDYGRAKRYFDKARTIYERLYPSDQFENGHEQLASILTDLGSISCDTGDFEQSRQFYEDVLKMQRGLYSGGEYPDGNPETASVLHQLCLISLYQNQYESAKEYCEIAMRMQRKIYQETEYPQGHSALAMSLHAMGSILSASGELEEASEYLQQALAMEKRINALDDLSERKLAIGSILIDLGRVFFKQAAHERARQCYKEAHRMATSWSWRTSLLHCVCEEELATLYYHAPDNTLKSPEWMIQDGVSYAEFAGTEASIAALHIDILAERYMSQVSEAEALNFAARFLGPPSLLLSITRNENIFMHYDSVFRRRGLIQQLTAGRTKRVRNATKEDIEQLHLQHTTISQDIARLMLIPDNNDSNRAELISKRLNVLTDKKEAMERQLADEAPLFGTQLGDSSIITRRSELPLIEHLPWNAVFLDIVRYNYHEKNTDLEVKWHPRLTPSYAAIVVRRGQPAIRVELGPAGRIDKAVKKWRHEISLTTKTTRASADEVRRLVWAPIEKRLSLWTKTVYICADGALTSLPWVAVPSSFGKNKVLLDYYNIAVVPNGQFLAEQLATERKANNSKGSLLIVGDVSYDSFPSAPESESTWRGLHDAARGDQRILWMPLPSTEREVAGISQLAQPREIRSLTGRQASTSRLLEELPNARWAHIATHGFFADSKFRSALQLNETLFEQQQSMFGKERTTVAGRNPLTLSGLVLAGANLPRPTDTFGIPQGDGGILTAQAIVGLPLSNLELAVLSACETGLGDVAGGEGVLGLQRAFHVAGARNVVASLWRVDDKATAAFMQLFYHKLWIQHKTPIEALREAQLNVYYNPDQINALAGSRGPDFTKTVKLVEENRGERGGKTADIRHWAAFVLSGMGR